MEERMYTREDLDVAVNAAYLRGRDDGYEAAAKNYEYEGY